MTLLAVLFDLDGTLLRTGGATTRAIRATLRELLGDGIAFPPITAGWLDHEIVVELARNNHVTAPEAFLEEYTPLYLRNLADELSRNPGDVVVLKGVRELLAALSSRPDVLTGILSGNFREGARLKLAAAGLDEQLFPITAYAEHGACRADLVPHVLCEAAGRGVEVTASQLLLIGDTPRDIACARQGGCHVLAVATGRYSLAELAALAPDLALPDLSDTAAVLNLVEKIGSCGNRPLSR